MVPGYIYTICYVVLSIVLVVNIYAVIFEKSIRVKSFIGTVASSAMLFFIYLFSAAEEQNDPACRADVVCWAEHFDARATSACGDEIERMAKYGIRWTDGFFGGKFSRVKWANQERGEIAFIGDQIEFQNGFGAWQNMIYECEFDTENKIVLDVDITSGRL
jgi:hypothetical protein